MMTSELTTKAIGSTMAPQDGDRGYIGRWCTCDTKHWNGGEPGGDRTLDPLIKSQVLYH